MKKSKNKSHASWPVVFVLLGLIDLGILIALMLGGTDVALFHPKGLIAQEEFKLILISVAVLMAIAIPSLFLFYFFAWKYRESNDNATYDPDRRHGKYFELTIWAIPCFFMLVMAVVMWSATHKLDPHTPIASSTKPLTVQVIAMRWKWLFIYPEQNIATVNFVQIPTDTPVQFELTADEVPMSSFWIPHLGGQLYAMTGHVNTLNLMAETPGDYQGSSAEINGAGFAGMKFMAQADSKETFDGWVQSVQQSNSDLDAAGYSQLLKPSENNSPQYYSNPAVNLYDTVVKKYSGSHDHNITAVENQ